MEQLSNWLTEVGTWGWVAVIIAAIFAFVAMLWGAFRLATIVFVIGQQLNKKDKESFEKRSN